MLIGTGIQRLILVWRREADSLKGSFIPNMKRKNTRSQKLAYKEKIVMNLKPDMKHMSFGMHYDEWKEACEPPNEWWLCTQQCNGKGFEPWKLCKCSWHSFSLVILCWSSSFFFFENTDWLPLSRRSDDSRNLILPFVWFNRLGIFYDGSRTIWHLINQLKYNSRVRPWCNPTLQGH